MTEELEFSAASYQQYKPDLMRIRNANRGDVRDESYFDWRYLGRPSVLPPVIVLARNGKGETVGALSLIPHSYWIGNAMATVGLLGDISVAREWRGKSVAQRMFRFLSGLEAIRELKCCVVLPNEPAARPLEKTGWSDVSRLDRYIRIVSIERMLRKHSCPAWLAKALSACATPAYELACSVSAPTRGEAYESAVIDGVDSRFDGLWERLKKEGMVIACRDSGHLAWRFARHPFRKYRFFVLQRGNELYGYVVFHVLEDSCYIDDVFCRNEPGLPARLLRAFVTNQRYAGTITTIAVSINRNFVSTAALGRLGFSRRRDFQRVMVKPRDNSDDELMFLSGQSWFMTSGDKDV